MINLLIILFVYFVSFKDKPDSTTPQLSPRAIEQRAKWHIANDELDYPVSAAYLNQVRAKGGTIHHVSRWFNGATVEMTVAQANAVSQLACVKSVEMTRDDSDPIYLRKRMPSYLRSQQAPLASSNYTDDQLQLYNLPPLHAAGFEGQGILMTVCDGGFQNANTLSCFRQSQELGHFDFTDDEDDFYGSTGDHGTKCLSVISGNANKFYGAATKADYYLMRSEEVEHESPKEMDNLVAALEKSDSLGVNVFSVSLGYAMFDNDDWTLPKSALDGKSTRVSLAATIAARKGMLVCVAAGNEGDDNWHTISVPADADSILTVGAVDTDGKIGSFSSYGPSADGRIKPEVCAVGVDACVWSPYGFATYSNGTSFATPLLAGMAAALWSALPDENAMQIRERIIRSSDRYTNPSVSRYGYGIPDAWKAYTMSLNEGIPIVHDDAQAMKILRNGQVLIIRGDEVYTITGQRVE